MKASTQNTFPSVAGGLDAYEFYVWFQLYFLCHECGESLDCPVADDDTEAPEGEWMRRNAERARSLGWSRVVVINNRSRSFLLPARRGRSI